MAAWLNSFFSGYDYAILSLTHKMAQAMGGVLTPLCKLITFLGEKGIIFFLLALAMMCFSKTRKAGICLFGAVCCGALITNVILKDSVERIRPFLADSTYKQWWTAVGSPAEDGFSFPSGHATAAAAGMTALTLKYKKKFLIPTVVVIVLMSFARNYLMAHYPSDVLFGSIFGILSGFIASSITDLIYRFLNKNKKKPVCDMVLNADVNINVSRLVKKPYKGKHDKP